MQWQCPIVSREWDRVTTGAGRYTGRLISLARVWCIFMLFYCRLYSYINVYDCNCMYYDGGLLHRQQCYLEPGWRCISSHLPMNLIASSPNSESFYLATGIAPISACPMSHVAPARIVARGPVTFASSLYCMEKLASCQYSSVRRCMARCDRHSESWRQQVWTTLARSNVEEWRWKRIWEREDMFCACEHVCILNVWAFVDIHWCGMCWDMCVNVNRCLNIVRLKTQFRMLL